ncbi:MAG: PQQ-binding-like beta-propeller repeat protein [Vicinamibacterales bacterium]|jgi:outer membrane protein assembly factor BamB|nr:PQQ-binding-like beta-propeller repeat protein [Vicinamibacterales bacterium]MDP7480968.1 PQQ-binding-like beta-propeller repeat protein [Vicinamibacterales bacterium]HJN44991.1 PQQ-binding-like beta-propeller repeat protein [Vicinamibacterales bacterium]|tara:strand:- start:3721 stop:5088 length:1368 start_codon:yes stop_codon:yes gene_type:complete
MIGRLTVIGVASVLLSLAGASSAVAQASDAERFWGQWRGPDATGVARFGNPPTEWSETRNIRWKVEIPGRGSASPIVWGDKLFLLTAVPVGEPQPVATADAGQQAPAGRGRGGRRGRRAIPMHRFIVMAIDRETGEIAWERVAREEVPHEGHQQPNGTYASGSAVTDGDHLFAFFGSWGLYAYDMDGNPLWEVDLGTRVMRNAFGEGTTPALHGNTLVVTWDHIGGQSFIVALDKRTGEELWRANRDEIDTWATPLIVEHEGRAQVITPAMDRVYSYDLETGEVVWQSRGTTMNAIPSSVHANGIVYVLSGYRGSNLQAIRLAGASGDIAGTDAIVWQLDRDTPYVPSPLLYDDALYVIKSNDGILSVFDPLTGTPHYQRQRLQGVPNVFASPVGVAGRVYIPGRDGTTLVIRHGDSFEVLASNTLDDGFDASPAIVGDEIYLRGYQYLYAIAEQ